LVAALQYAASLPNGGDLTELDQLKRRGFITLLGGAAAWHIAARAQQPGTVWLIAFITHARNPDLDDQLFESLRQLGYVEGQNIIVERRYAQGKAERFQELGRRWFASRLTSS
jgi:hypothetical protein